MCYRREGEEGFYLFLDTRDYIVHLAQRGGLLPFRPAVATSERSVKNMLLLQEINHPNYEKALTYLEAAIAVLTPGLYPL